MKVEFSEDDGRSWVEATLGADHGPYSFRSSEHTWRPLRAGTHVIAVRATDAMGNVQPDAAVWNPGGYLWNRIEERKTMTGHRCLGIILLAAAGALAPASTALSQATKLPGLVQEGNYGPGNLGMQMQPAPRHDDAGAVYAVGPWPTYTPPLAAGEGRELVQSFCGICHSTTYITMQPPLPGATWEAVVNKMIGTFGAPVPEPAAQATPETRKE